MEALPEHPLERESVMSNSPLRTVFALVLAAFLLATPTAQALPLSGDSDVLARIWSFFTDFWSKNGCRIDPSGYCSPGMGEGDPTTENGCVIEPNGQCTTTPVSTKNGCVIDPSGICRP